MSNIESVSKSIKKKLTLKDYTTETHNAVLTEEPKNVETLTPSPERPTPIDIKPAKPKKVKRTFYIDVEIDSAFDKHYAKLLLNGEKVDKSELISQAITNFLQEGK